MTKEQAAEGAEKTIKLLFKNTGLIFTHEPITYGAHVPDNDGNLFAFDKWNEDKPMEDGIYSAPYYGISADVDGGETYPTMLLEPAVLSYGIEADHQTIDVRFPSLKEVAIFLAFLGNRYKLHSFYHRLREGQMGRLYTIKEFNELS